MTAASFVMAYSIQLGVIGAVTAIVLARTARGLPRLRLVTWRAVVAAAWLLPVTAVWQGGSDPASAPQLAMTSPVVLGPVSATFTPAVSPEWAPWLGAMLIAGAIGRLIWVAATIAAMRRRLHSMSPAHLPAFDELRASIGVEARLLCLADVDRPFTFGDAPPLVVLPAWTRGSDDDMLRAMLTHELLHVARRDWRWMVVEECALAPIWFHPVGWLARRELGQAREEIVDRATVARTGSKRRYLETLLALAERQPPSMALAIPVFTMRQLPRRVAALLSEVPMSHTRSVAAALFVVASASVGLAAAAHVVPLPAADWITPGQQASPSGPGPLERQAYVAPRDAPPPPRLTYVAPRLPETAAITGEVDVELRLVVDSAGSVAEARAISVSGGATGSSAEAIGAAVTATARKWQFAAPAAAPLALTTTLTLEPSESKGVAEIAIRERPLPVNLIAATYPDDAQKAGIEGTAEVAVTVDETGNVSEARVVKATTPSMGEAAMTALRASTFRPGMRDGEPVAVMVTIAMRFALK